jgi:hypothetical protein
MNIHRHHYENPDPLSWPVIVISLGLVFASAAHGADGGYASPDEAHTASFGAAHAGSRGARNVPRHRSHEDRTSQLQTMTVASFGRDGPDVSLSLVAPGDLRRSGLDHAISGAYAPNRQPDVFLSVNYPW